MKTTSRPFSLIQGLILFALSLFLAPSHAWAWGAPHTTITQAATAALPDWQQKLLGEELKPLGSLYCAIPDLVFTRKDLTPYAMMDSRPGVVYLKILHVPTTPSENHEVLRYFMDKAVTALKAGNIGDAARYAGTLAHVLEDWGCPAHAVPGDNMFTLFKQFLPPPPALQYTLLHSPIEGGVFTVRLDSYRPRLLGTSVDEAAFNLLRRAQEATVNARSQVVPIIQALYASDTNASNAAQQKAALFDAAVVADALHTVCCLSQKRFAEGAAPTGADLSALLPLQAPDLYFPQATFFSKPYWGHATPGVLLLNGTNAVPLRLNVLEQGQMTAKTFTSGIGTGTRSVLTYLVPTNVYARFTAQVGLQVELGKSGNVIFEVSGNDRPLARLGPITGDQPAQTVDVALAGVTNLQLTVTSAAGDGSGNYAVWANPRLEKAPQR
jgi:hypothetical protein